MCTPVLRPVSSGAGRPVQRSGPESGSRSLTEIVRRVPSGDRSPAARSTVSEGPTEPTPIPPTSGRRIRYRAVRLGRIRGICAGRPGARRRAAHGGAPRRRPRRCRASPSPALAGARRRARPTAQRLRGPALVGGARRRGGRRARGGRDRRRSPSTTTTASSGAGVPPSVMLRPSDRIGRTGDIAAILQADVPAVVAIVDDGGPDSGGAAGTGFVISSDGVIVTNNHVVEGADDRSRRVFSDGTKRDARRCSGTTRRATSRCSRSTRTELPDHRARRLRRACRSATTSSRSATRSRSRAGSRVTRGIISGLHREVRARHRRRARRRASRPTPRSTPATPAARSSTRRVGSSASTPRSPIPASAQNVGFAIPISTRPRRSSSELRGRAGSPRSSASRPSTSTPAKRDGEPVDRRRAARSCSRSPPARPPTKAGHQGRRRDRRGRRHHGHARRGRSAAAIRQHKPGDKVDVIVDRDGDAGHAARRRSASRPAPDEPAACTGSEARPRTATTLDLHVDGARRARAGPAAGTRARSCTSARSRRTGRSTASSATAA